MNHHEKKVLSFLLGANLITWLLVWLTRLDAAK